MHRHIACGTVPGVGTYSETVLHVATVRLCLPTCCLCCASLPCIFQWTWTCSYMLKFWDCCCICEVPQCTNHPADRVCPPDGPTLTLARVAGGSEHDCGAYTAPDHDCIASSMWIIQGHDHNVMGRDSQSSFFISFFLLSGSFLSLLVPFRFDSF